MELMNLSVYSCADTSLGCSCGDCPSSPACSNPEPPPHKKELCSITILSIEVRIDEIHIHIVLEFLCHVLLSHIWAGRKFQDLGNSM